MVDGPASQLVRLLNTEIPAVAGVENTVCIRGAGSHAEQVVDKARAVTVDIKQARALPYM